ncbi:MAG TPA: large conductance mechanosensitive channel protein MscL [Clostridiales bacterium]|nr:large conductance mechanosensitive channel protein MscL [Clostridiales bacterium]
MFRKFSKEFKEFAMKGNVLDLAVGVIIGGAFGKIVTSLVQDIIMPIIGTFTAGLDFKDMKILLKSAVTEGEKIIKPQVTLNYGSFIQTVVDFLIIAFSIFIFIKMINKARKKFEHDTAVDNTAVDNAATPPVEAKPTELDLLTEIRDILKHHE